MSTEGTADGLDHLLRTSRPAAPEPGSLERRLSIASILSASRHDGARPRLGRLEVQSRIGGGAMGVVYRAYDPELQRLVAVKLLRGWTAADQRRRIVDEARRLARLTHPNVVAVHDIVDDDGGLYFTMEHVAGTTLRGWLEQHPSASWREVLEWFVQSGRGLAAAHAAKMVHRDFKPENVLVGDDGRARVADFGLADVLQDGGDGEVAGTPYYMAPEVQAGLPAGPASDQFSLSIALRDALDGRGAPADVNHAVERGLAVSPADRHGSLDEMVAHLASTLAESGDARPRALLLDRVERIWLRGVLERSLGPAGVVDLTLVAAPDLVAPPWKDWSEPRAPTASIPAPRAATSSRRLTEVLGESHGSLVLIGPPGAGKTTLLLHLCRELWRSASLDPAAPAPAMLSLSTYHPGRGDDEARSRHFLAWVVDELVLKYGLPRPAVKRWLDASAIVLLLDGLDETDPAVRAEVVATLNVLAREQPVSMVVTCRDEEYEALDTRLAFGAAERLQPLDDAGVLTLLEGRHATDLADQVARDPQLREILRNPLLLTLYAVDPPTGAAAHDPGWVRAYGRYVEAVWARAGDEARASVEPALVWLARAMRRQNTSDLWLERLHFGWLGQRWEAIAGYLCGVIVVGLFSVGLNLAQVPYTHYPVPSALVFGVGVWVSSFAYTRGHLVPVESLRWSFRRAARLVPITTACALTIGLIEAVKVNFAANMAGAGITGAILALLFALEPGERATKVRPNAGIRRSMLNATLLSFGAGIPVALLFYHVVQPHITHPLAVVRQEYVRGDPALIVGVAVGLFVFTAMFLIYGGFTAIMHFVLRIWLAARSPLPLDLVGLLERAADLGFVRRVGGGYVFLHRTLLDYFADHGPLARDETPQHGSARDQSPS